MTTKLQSITLLILSLYVVTAVALLAWVIVYSGSGDGDTLEHVHSSWLVFTGKIPYKDFFQHHNPLLWYVGAPFVGAYQFSLKAVDAANFLTVFTTVLTLCYMIRLHKDFLSNTLGGLVAAAFFALPHESLYNKDFKPDNFMTACLIIGLYYLFCHLKNKKLFPLCLSFLIFFAGFMFTQKASLILLGIGGILLFFIYKKELSFTACVQAAVLPMLLYCAFLGFLYSEDILRLYFKANFELNARIPDVFFTRRFITPSLENVVPLLLSLYVLWRLTYQGSIYLKITALIFITEYLIRLYYFTPFVYYFSFLMAISSLLAGVAVADLSQKTPQILWGMMAYFLFVGGWYINTYHWRITVSDSFKYGASGFVLANTTPCDYVLNGYRIGYNLFSKDLDYMWNLQGQIDVIAATIGIRPLADLEALIRKRKPKIIQGEDYYDTYRAYRGYINVFPIHQISPLLLQEMYTPTGRDNLYILKPEYQKYDCRYNPQTKNYEYVD